MQSYVHNQFVVWSSTWYSAAHQACRCCSIRAQSQCQARTFSLLHLPPYQLRSTSCISMYLLRSWTFSSRASPSHGSLMALSSHHAFANDNASFIALTNRCRGGDLRLDSWPAAQMLSTSTHQNMSQHAVLYVSTVDTHGSVCIEETRTISQGPAGLCIMTDLDRRQAPAVFTRTFCARQTPSIQHMAGTTQHRQVS